MKGQYCYFLENYKTGSEGKKKVLANLEKKQKEKRIGNQLFKMTDVQGDVQKNENSSQLIEWDGREEERVEGLGGELEGKKNSESSRGDKVERKEEEAIGLF